MNNQDTCSGTKLLVAIDDSIPAQWAITTAKKFASRIGGELMLVNVIPAPEPVGPEAVFAGTQLDVHSHMQKESASLLSAAQQKLSGTQCQIFTREGSPSEQILALAEELNVGMIVMGSRGRNRFAEFLLGSTAEDVIRRAKCPVMTVSHEPKGCGCANK